MVLLYLMSCVYVYRCVCGLGIDVICVGVAVCGVSVVIRCMLCCCVFWFYA